MAGNVSLPPTTSIAKISPRKPTLIGVRGNFGVLACALNLSQTAQEDINSFISLAIRGQKKERDTRKITFLAPS